MTVLLLNLSRDQLDRSGEVRQMAQRWRHDVAMIDAQRDVTFIANVNDPLVSYAVAEAKTLRAVAVAPTWLGDGASCPQCTNSLTFEAGFLCGCHHQEVHAGTWTCRCGFARPEPTTILAEQLHLDGSLVDLALALPGEFNRANAALAVTAALTMGATLHGALRGMALLQTVEGRFEVRRRAGRTWRLMLAKNPAGVAALFATLESSEDVLICINDQIADGRDPSWLYDAPFEQLATRTVWCGGSRKLDLATRLDYAGVTWKLTDENDLPSESRSSSAPMTVIANYTAFAGWRKRSEPC